MFLSSINIGLKTFKAASAALKDFPKAASIHIEGFPIAKFPTGFSITFPAAYEKLLICVLAFFRNSFVIALVALNSFHRSSFQISYSSS
jgi:hypothetical protein